MKLLLDTHAFIWLDLAMKKISRTAMAACQNPDNERKNLDYASQAPLHPGYTDWTTRKKERKKGPGSIYSDSPNTSMQPTCYALG